MEHSPMRMDSLATRNVPHIPKNRSETYLVATPAIFMEPKDTIAYFSNSFRSLMMYFVLLD